MEAREWARAFDAIECSGISAALVGTTLRVPRASASDMRRALGDLAADVTEEPATLEERFLELSGSGGVRAEAAT